MGISSVYKYVYFTLFLIVLIPGTKAASVEDILALKAKIVLHPTWHEYPFVSAVEFAFGQKEPFQPYLEGLRKRIVTRVDFYSDKREGSKKERQELNRYRLSVLKELLPGTFEINETQWNVFFHKRGRVDGEQRPFIGFVVYYQPSNHEGYAFRDDFLGVNLPPIPLLGSAVIELPDVEEQIQVSVLKKELDISEHPPRNETSIICNSETGAYPKGCPIFPEGCDGLEKYLGNIYKAAEIKVNVFSTALTASIDCNGRMYLISAHGGNGAFRQPELIANGLLQMPNWQMPELKGDTTFDLKVVLTVSSRYGQFNLEIEEMTFTKKMTYSRVSKMGGEVDSTIFKFFERKGSLNQAAVVFDVTGSMSSQVNQLLYWSAFHFRENDNYERFYCFHNDGDNRPDTLKLVGKVEGLYSGEMQSVEEVRSLARRAMIAGNGGDLEENNFEAVLHTLEEYPDCKEIIMMADNWATPRDTVLLNQIELPIQIVLCGTKRSVINTAYLDLVRRNGGSLHTLKSDIMDLGEVENGETLSIDGNDYKLSEGRFSFIGLTPKL